MPPWPLRPFVLKLMWPCARNSGRERMQTTGGISLGDPSSPCPPSSERVSMDFTLLSELPEPARTESCTTPGSQPVAEFPGEDKSALIIY